MLLLDTKNLMIYSIFWKQVEANFNSHIYPYISFILFHSVFSLCINYIILLINCFTSGYFSSLHSFFSLPISLSHPFFSFFLSTHILPAIFHSFYRSLTIYLHIVFSFLCFYMTFSNTPRLFLQFLCFSHFTELPTSALSRVLNHWRSLDRIISYSQM